MKIIASGLRTNCNVKIFNKLKVTVSLSIYEKHVHESRKTVFEKMSDYATEEEFKNGRSECTTIDGIYDQLVEQRVGTVTCC